MLRRVAVLAFAAMGVFCHSAHAEVRYTVKDLGTLGGTVSAPTAINNAGDVVGGSRVADGSNHAFLYRNGVMRDLGAPFGTENRAVDINASGQVVVESSDLTSFRSFLYQDGRYTNLGGSSDRSVRAAGINDAGQVVGALGTATGSNAFLYSDGTLQDLGTFGALAARAQSINNSGQITGAFDKPNPITGVAEVHGFLLENGVVRDFGANTGLTEINDLGHFVRYDAASDDFILNRNGQETPLEGGRPSALNNTGGIVGDAFVNGSIRATVFENGQAIDLNTLTAPGSGLTLRQALDINDSGLIVGTATTAVGDLHAFLLTPVPEPAGLAGLLLGVVLLRRRRAV